MFRDWITSEDYGTTLRVGLGGGGERPLVGS